MSPEEMAKAEGWGGARLAVPGDLYQVRLFYVRQGSKAGTAEGVCKVGEAEEVVVPLTRAQIATLIHDLAGVLMWMK